ncbi:MAG: hypothetical protein IKZ14_07930 [Muribaculaceae bacterium]|nr:hypothetical protein [Muribaculaceae bacterium]
MHSHLKTALCCIIGIVALLCVSGNATAQELTFPTDSCNVTYNMQIDIRNGYVSGFCMLVKEDNIVKSSIVNEFGVSIIDFTYDTKKDKVKLKYVMKALNKWYIKRVLKKDLKQIMYIMQQGGNEHNNSANNLHYKFSLIANQETTD